MLSILINAYACSPNMGSEPGMAWNWCIHLAKHCELYIITEGEFRNKIEAVLPTLPQSKNMHFYYNPVSDKIRRMCWNQGDWRFYYYYRQWQKKTLEIARNIIKEHPIDIIHQLNMIGFREPGYLWRLDKPFVWGPINAKERFPIDYLQGTSWKNVFFIFMKNILNRMQLKYAYRVKQAVNKAGIVIAASSDSIHTLKKYFNCNAVLVNESGCDVLDTNFILKKINTKYFDLLWVGRFIFTKQLKLALEAIARTQNSSIRLHVVGGCLEDEISYKLLADKLGIGQQCIWYQKIAHKEVQELMQKCDLFFFTSIAEGTPHVILEAIGNNLPVLCFNTCGQGDCVTDKVGMKIELSNPEQSVQEFAEKINYLYTHREILKTLSANCFERQRELSWERKAEQMIKLYEKVLA